MTTPTDRTKKARELLDILRYSSDHQEDLRLTLEFFAEIEAETIERCIDAAGQAAWRHEGSDGYSVGLDRGAREQVKACVDAIRALSPAR